MDATTLPKKHNTKQDVYAKVATTLPVGEYIATVLDTIIAHEYRTGDPYHNKAVVITATVLCNDQTLQAIIVPISTWEDVSITPSTTALISIKQINGLNVAIIKL